MRKILAIVEETVSQKSVRRKKKFPFTDVQRLEKILEKYFSRPVEDVKVRRHGNASCDFRLFPRRHGERANEKSLVEIAVYGADINFKAARYTATGAVYQGSFTSRKRSKAGDLLILAQRFANRRQISGAI